MTGMISLMRRKAYLRRPLDESASWGSGCDRVRVRVEVLGCHLVSAQNQKLRPPICVDVS